MILYVIKKNFDLYIYWVLGKVIKIILRDIFCFICFVEIIKDLYVIIIVLIKINDFKLLYINIFVGIINEF